MLGSLAASPTVAIGTRVVIVADGLRYAGVISSELEYARWFDQQLDIGFAAYAEAHRGKPEGRLAEAVREAAGGRIAEVYESRAKEREAAQEQARELEAAGEPVPEEVDRAAHADRKSPVLVLKDVELYGTMPKEEMPFVRVRVDSISAWWFDPGAPEA